MDRYDLQKYSFNIENKLTDMCSDNDIHKIMNNDCINPVYINIGRPYNITVCKNMDIVVSDRMNGIYKIKSNGDVIKPDLPVEASFNANITYNYQKDEIVYTTHKEELYVLSCSELNLKVHKDLPWKNIYDFDDGYSTTEYDLSEYWVGAGHGKRIAKYDMNNYNFKGYVDINYDEVLGAYLRWYRPEPSTLILLSEWGIYRYEKQNMSENLILKEKRFYISPFHEVYYDHNSKIFFFSNFLFYRVQYIVDRDISNVMSLYTDKGPRWLVYDRDSDILYVSNYSERVVTLIDVKRNIILKHIMVGPRPRGISKDIWTGKIFVVSGCGVFNLNVDDKCLKANWYSN
jgi:hypothetical protein